MVGFWVCHLIPMLRASARDSEIARLECAALSKSLQRCVRSKDAQHETNWNHETQAAVRFREYLEMHWTSLCLLSRFNWTVLSESFRDPCQKQSPADFCSMFYLQILRHWHFHYVRLLCQVLGSMSTFHRALSYFGMWSYGNADAEKEKLHEVYQISETQINIHKHTHTSTKFYKHP